MHAVGADVGDVDEVPERTDCEPEEHDRDAEPMPRPTGFSPGGRSCAS